MKVMLLKPTGPSSWRCPVQGPGTLWETSMEHILVNDLPDPKGWDLVLTAGFDLDEYRIDALLLRGALRDGVPIVRVDR